MRRFPRFRAPIPVEGSVEEQEKCPGDGSCHHLTLLGKPSQGRGDSLDGIEGSWDHGKVWVRRDLKDHPTPKNPTGHLPSSQVAPIPIQTLPWGSHSFSRLGRSAGNGCELPQPQLLSGRFLPGMFSPPGSVNPLSGRVLVSSTSSGFALTSIPEFPQCRCHPEPPLSPSQKLF